MNEGYAYRAQIDATGAGLTVLAYLARHHPHATEATWGVRIAAGEVSVGDRVVDVGQILRPGDWVVWNRPSWVEASVPLHFEVIYDDGDVLAVSKPSGLPTAPGGGFLENTLVALVRRQFPDAAPLHRLGRGTSGLVLFARLPATRTALAFAWRRHEVRKIYRALAAGTPDQDRFAIDAPIGPIRHPLLGEVFAANPAGKQAHSDVTVIRRRGADTIVDVEIQTGRPHQIRIHLAAAGHPLVGDPLYVAGGGIVEGCTALPGDLGYLLHARRLEFVHPGTGKRVEIDCAPPVEIA